jgi:hypothetical protein
LIAAEAGAVVRLPVAGEAGLTLASAPGTAAELLGILERLGALEALPEPG